MMTVERPALGEKVLELTLPDHRLPLVAGDDDRLGTEFTVPHRTKRKMVRARFLYARLTAKGWEITGYDGRQAITVRADEIRTVHASRKIPASPDTMRPPARRRGR